ncbi:MAG: endonuclease/exonuclease/phosphatase [Niabella sp.]
MKKIFLSFGLAVSLFACKKETPANAPGGQPADTSSTSLIDYNKDITIANWNIEWFGYASQFNGDLDEQEANAGKILKYLDADLYGLCEIADTARFGRMVRSNLSNEYKYVISFYTSGAQKLAFVYNKNIFRKVSVRPFMGVSANAYYNFGYRYPYILTAEVAVNATKNVVSFILIHAKADADAASYTRRLDGAAEMKDSLDTYYGNKSFIVMGDYNDNLDKSITTGKPTPYQDFLNDSARYNAITLPLNIPGNQSTLSYANSVIDQQMVSSTMTKWLVTSSVKIRTDVTTVVADYTSGNTSDHYPVTSVYHITD